MYRHHFPSFATLYLGGGTPSLLTVGHIATLLNTAARVFTLSASLEITVEVNPADQDKLWLRELLRLGVSPDCTGCSVLGRRGHPLLRTAAYGTGCP